MRIGMVLGKPFPPDIRLEKEIRALAAAGHRLLVLAENRGDEPAREIAAGAIVCRCLPPAAFQRRLDWLRFQATFRSGYWCNRIARFVQQNRLEALHVHDLPLVGTALEIAASRGLPLVADLHENYPAAKQLWSEGSRDPLVWFGDDPRRWERYERRVLPLADQVITVVDEAAERLVSAGTVSAERMTVVSNVEELEWFDALADATTAGENCVRLVYVGGVKPHRGLDQVVRALAELPQGLDVRLRIVGVRGRYGRELAALAQECGVGDRIELVEWQPLTAIPNTIRKCDIGLVPHRKHAHTDATIPHKLFQYMLASRPVIVSNCRPLARIIRETDAGLVFESGNVSELARRIAELAANPGLREEMGRRGRAAAAARYNWETEGQKLVALYDKISAS